MGMGAERLGAERSGRGARGPARMRARKAALLAAGLALAAGCSGSAKGPAEPGFVLVTLDTTRADRLGCAGNPTVRTPHLDRLERRGIQWSDAVTAIPLTTPSHATILSGRMPRSHGLVKNRMRLDPSVVTLAQRLDAAGWRTGAIVSSGIVLGPEFGLDRGFDTYEVIEPDTRPASGEGAKTAAAAVAWLDAHGGEGAFLWAHFFDAHLPYLPPAPLDRLYDPDYAGDLDPASPALQARLHKTTDADPADIRHVAARYAGEITFLDLCVGRLARAVEARHPGMRFLVTADHGEGLYEHDRYFGHDTILYETSVRIPMILSPAPSTFRGRFASSVCPEDARTVDLAPTLLALAGEPLPSEFEGRDLIGELPRAGGNLQFVMESHPSETKGGDVYALRTDGEKVILRPSGKRESYDLRADPAERHDISGRRLPLYTVLHEDLILELERLPVGSTATVDAERGGIDERTREALRSLGYVDP